MVIYIGVMAQIKSVVPIPLPTQMHDCDCFVNGTAAASIVEEVDLTS